MGGVAGTRDVFSTADDLAIFCQMILNGGEYEEDARSGALHCRANAERSLAADLSQMRGIGWDVNTSFSSTEEISSSRNIRAHRLYWNKHLDRPGNGIVRYPADKSRASGRQGRRHEASLVCCFHRRGRDNQSAISAALFDLAAPHTVESPRAPITRSSPSGPLHPVLAGIDVLVRDGSSNLEGRRIGLITNHTGRDRLGRSTIDLLAGAKNLKVVALFRLEHGLRGASKTAIVGDSRG